MKPPHLPPQTCSVNRHRQWQRIKILLASAVFGLVAGVSGASMTLGWIWPGMGGGDSWVVSQRLGAASRNQLEERVAIESGERVAEIYSAVQTVNGAEILPQKNYLGQAVVVSSDGWLAMYLPAAAGNWRLWQAAMPGGAVYGVDKFLSDKLSGLAFLHLVPKEAGSSGASAQFKVAPLADGLNLNQDLYVFDNNIWQWAVKVADQNSFSNYPHLDSAPIERAVLNGDFSAGRPVMTSQGRLAGFAVGGRDMLPFQYLNRLLPGVLNEQKIIYPTLGAEGWYSAEQLVVLDGQTVKGFFVSRAASPLRAGDIILQINGVLAENDKMWYNVKAPETAKLKIRRNGKEYDFEAQITRKVF